MPRLFIGNIPHASTNVELQQWVESRGFPVESAEVIYDRGTGKSRGFGFVTLAGEVAAHAAISVMNGRRMDGRILTVNEATPLTTPGVAYAEEPERLPRWADPTGSSLKKQGRSGLLLLLLPDKSRHSSATLLNAACRSAI